MCQCFLGYCVSPLQTATYKNADIFFEMCVMTKNFNLRLIWHHSYFRHDFPPVSIEKMSGTVSTSCIELHIATPML